MFLLFDEIPKPGHSLLWLEGTFQPIASGFCSRVKAQKDVDLAASTDTGVERESLGAGRAARGTETSWQEAGLLQDISCPRDSATGALLFTAGALQLQEGKTQGRCKGLKKTEATVWF